MSGSWLPPRVLADIQRELERAAEQHTRVQESLADMQPNASGTYTFRYHTPTPTGDTVVGEVVSVKEEPL